MIHDDHRRYLPPGLQQAELHWPDTTCQRAIEDRDLLAEARNLDGCAGAMLACMLLLYPLTARPTGEATRSLRN